MTAWTDQRGEWVRRAKRRQLLAVVAEVAAGYGTDENLGDTTERIETVLWLATRGERGSEWGHAGDPAADVGGWVDPDPDPGPWRA